MATGRTLPTLLPDWGKAWTILSLFVFGWRSASSAGGLAQAFAAGFTSKGALPLSLLVLERQGGAVHPNGLSAGPSRAVPFFELSIGTRFPPYPRRRKCNDESCSTPTVPDFLPALSSPDCDGCSVTFQCACARSTR